MDIQKEQKINADLFKEKIDTNLLYGSIEITLFNKLFKNKLINEKIYKQAKENIIKEYKLDKNWCQEISENNPMIYNLFVKHKDKIYLSLCFILCISFCRYLM